MSNTKSKVVNGERYHIGTTGDMSKEVAIGIGTNTYGENFFEWEDSGELVSKEKFLLSGKPTPWTMKTIPKNGVLVKNNKSSGLCLITAIRETSVTFSNVVVTYEELLEDYKYLDSNEELKPCGVVSELSKLKVYLERNLPYWR